MEAIEVSVTFAVNYVTRSTGRLAASVTYIVRLPITGNASAGVFTQERDQLSARAQVPAESSYSPALDRQRGRHIGMI